MNNFQVKIYGVVGHNLGDEAIAVAATHEILRLMPDASVSIASSSRRGLQGLYRIGELRNDRRSLGGVIEFARSVRGADLVLIGGGTLVQDRLGLGLLRGNLAYSLQVALLAKLFRKPVGALAIGVDELQTKRGRAFSRWFLQLMNAVLVRDDRSLCLAELYTGGTSGAGATEASWFVGADPAFLIETKSISRSQEIPFSNYLVLSLVNEGICWVPFLDQLAECISHLREAGTIDGVVLLAMDDRPSEELSIFKAWRNRHPHLQSVTKVYVPYDVYDAAIVIRQARLMVAARLHAMILGLGSVPFLAISRTTKTENFLEYTQAVGIEAGSSVNSVELTAMLMSILEDSEALVAQQRILQSLKQRARTGIERLLERWVASRLTPQNRQVAN